MTPERMTPERLAEIERRARVTSFDAYYQRTILDLIAHIRYLEAQLALEAQLVAYIATATPPSREVGE